MVVSAQLKILDYATLNQRDEPCDIYEVERVRNIKRKQRARLALTHKNKAECSATQLISGLLSKRLN